MIPQRIIDKYNNGQDGYRVSLEEFAYQYYIESKNSLSIISTNDLLFNLKYEFAKTVFGSEQIIGGIRRSYKYHLKQLAITDDKIKYLEEHVK